MSVHYSRWVVEIPFPGDEHYPERVEWGYMQIFRDGEVERYTILEKDSLKIPTFFPTERHAEDKIDSLILQHGEDPCLLVAATIEHSRVPYKPPESK